jgi:hypothetical protein
VEGDVWARFALDPRDPAAAPLRASDADREVIHGVLADAFATGRLDRAEYDERISSVLSARTLGELPPVVADLVPSLPARTTSGYVPLVAATPLEIEQRAVAAYEEARRNAFMGFLGPSIICWVIWIAASSPFPWPLIVMAATGVNLVRTFVMREQMIAEETRRLQKKQARELDKKRRGE